MKELFKKLKDNDELTYSEKRIILETLKEQGECIRYYSQNFVGIWDSDRVNINWRAKKCIDHINNKIQEIKES